MQHLKIKQHDKNNISYNTEVFKNSICGGILEMRVIFYRLCEYGLVCAHLQKTAFIILTTTAILYLVVGKHRTYILIRSNVYSGYFAYCA